MNNYFPSMKVTTGFVASFLIIALFSGFYVSADTSDFVGKPLAVRAFERAVTPEIRIHDEAALFRINTIELIDESYMLEFVNSVKAEVKDREVNISIVGHTCDLGTDSYNKRLGEQRAYAIMDYFVMLGLNINVIEVSSEGEARPVVSNSSEAHRQKNRRVAITIESVEAEDLVLEGTFGTAVSEVVLQALPWSAASVHSHLNAPGCSPERRSFSRAKSVVTIWKQISCASKKAFVRSSKSMTSRSVISHNFDLESIYPYYETNQFISGCYPAGSGMQYPW